MDVEGSYAAEVRAAGPLVVVTGTGREAENWTS